MPRDEALQLITIPAQRENVDLAPHAEAIMAMAGRHPMMLQIACSCAFEEVATRGGSDPDWQAIRSAFDEEALPHYLAAWSHLDAAEHQCLAAIARGKPIGKQLLFAREQLLRSGVLWGDADTTEFAACAFRDFVRRALGIDERRAGWMQRLIDAFRTG